MGSPAPVVNPALWRSSCSTVMSKYLGSFITFVKAVSLSIPFAPNTCSESFIFLSSTSFIIPTAVSNLDTDASLMMFDGCISCPASLSAHPKPLA